MYVIGKRFGFAASHVLEGMPNGHPCSRLHGHNYVVEVVLKDNGLDQAGMVADFGRLAVIRSYLDDVFDHRHLNDVLPVTPTSENLASHLFDWCRCNVEPFLADRLHAVRVSETDTSWAEPAVTRGPGELMVAEIFGPTVQGEGPSTGRRAVFVRLSGCNLSCSWCDTPYTWDTSRFDLRTQRRLVPASKLTAHVLAVDAPLVVVTGGEPLLQANAMASLVARCREAGRDVEVETNGTIAPPPSLLDIGVRWNVSAKLANSEVPRSRRIRPEVLRAFTTTGTAVSKFVVSTVADLDEVADLQRRLRLSPVWVIPRKGRPRRRSSGPPARSPTAS